MAGILTPARRRAKSSSPEVSAERVTISTVVPLDEMQQASVRTLPFSPHQEDDARLVTATIRTAAALRGIRDSGAFRDDGAHTFREWAMNKFGERLGAFLDETL